MMPRFLDTNILLRYLTRDDEVKARACLALLLRVERAEEVVVTSDLVIAETVFTLQSPRQYGLSRDRMFRLFSVEPRRAVIRDNGQMGFGGGRELRFEENQVYCNNTFSSVERDE